MSNWTQRCQAVDPQGRQCTLDEGHTEDHRAAPVAHQGVSPAAALLGFGVMIGVIILAWILVIKPMVGL